MMSDAQRRGPCADGLDQRWTNDGPKMTKGQNLGAIEEPRPREAEVCGSRGADKPGLMASSQKIRT